MNHPGNWPLASRAALLILVGLCCAGAGLILHALPLSSVRGEHENQLRAIKAEFQAALSRNAALPMLQARSQQLAARLASTGKQPGALPDTAPLQVSLGIAAERHRLALQAFRPLTDGAEFDVVGDYAGMLLFVAELSQSPHALLFASIDISVQRTMARPRLLMKANVRHQPLLFAATNQEPAHP